MVSERAIAADQRGEYLLVVNDKNEVEYRPSELGISVNGMRVIKSGVKEGEWVVINGLQRARPKSVVVPVQHTMAGEPLQPAVEQPAAQVTAAAATTTRDGG
jgi:multidrug efflux system membrane fusion protein